MATRRLELKVCEAHGVVAALPSELYCRVECAESTGKTELVAAPQWQQEFEFGDTSILGDRVVFTVSARHGGEAGASSSEDVVLGVAVLEIERLTPNTRQHIALPLGAPAEADVSASVPAADAELVVEVYFECEEVKTKEEEDVEQVKEDIEAEKEKEEEEEVPLPELPVLLPRVTSDAVSLHEEPAHEEPVPAPPPAPSVVVPPTLSPMSSSISDAPDLPPNTIVLTILEARDLVARDGTGPEASSDPLVKISCSKNDPQRTRVLKKTLRPKWRQRFFFYLTHSRQVIDLRVEDDDMFTNDFLGRCTIDLEQWRAQFPNDKRVMWIALEPKKATGDASVSDLSPDRSMSYGLGKICVAIELRHIDREIESLEQGETDHATVVPSSRSAQATNGNIASPTATSQSVVDESFTEMQLGDGEEAAPLSPVGSVASAAAFAGEESDSDDESVQQETADEIKKRQEERQKMFAELSDVRIVPGDYQILVRIIEVRDLKPMDVNGLCDPVVSVECLGQRQHTMVKQKQLSCVFDEYLAFNFKGLEADAVQEGSIKITVLDADGPGLTAVSSSKVVSRLASDTIGFFVVDIPYVYFQKNHELHRKWVALVGAGKDNSDSIQGYLLLSIAVIGPGDKIRIHPPEEDEEAEDAVTSVKSKKDINSLVLVPPRVTQTLSYLVVTIYQAQDIPNMDAGLVNRGGVDGYARVYFAGLDVLETKRVTVKGTGNLTVEFNQELWFPILLPTMSNNIFISLWDWDMTTDELVGNMAPYLFYQVQKYPELFGPHWTNLYGPPVGVSTDSRARKRMFEHPKTASTYRGRVLLSLRVEDGSKSVNGRPHTRNLTAAMPQVPTRSYILRAALFFGTEIPQFASMTSWNRNSKMGIKITIGRHELVSTREHNRMGTCSWNQYIDLPDIELPMDLEYVPDVFVYLYRRHMNDLRCMCFARFSAKDVFCPAETLEGLREIPQPTWVSFQEDRAMDDLKDHDFTGNVLMNLRLEGSPSSAVAPDLAQRWRQHAAKNLSYTKYTVLVHVFQAKCLPATDSNGSLDPYVTVTCAGAKGQVSKRLCTRDPCFYETVCLDVELPKDEAFLPKVSVQVFDYDQWDTDDYIGSAKFSLTDVRLMSSTEYKTQREQGTYAPPRPSWHPISHTIPGDTDGELLLSVELVRKDTPGAVVEPPESIHPPMEDQFLEITCLGCRGLQPVGFMPLNTPFLRFEVGDSTKNSTVRYTNPSAKPSGRNPNILERVVIPVKMPVDALYAPRLNITVFDQLLGGFYKPMLGSCSVDLSTKMPLSNGQPNPVYRDNLDEAFEGNPYVSRPTDYSTFPGTIPVSSSTTSSEDTPENPKPMLTKASQSDVGVGVAPLTSKLSLHLKASDLDDGDDDEDLPPYLHRREIMDGPLEEELSKPPFKTFSLFRGDMIARKRLLGGTSEADFRSVGKFKGIVRLLKHKDEPPLLNLDQFLMPQSYLVRVYVLDAANIQPKDENNKSDPYLRLSLGDGRKRHHLINDRHNYCKATLTPKFHKMYEFKAQLPGASELRIEVLDYDFLAIPTIPIGVSNGLTSVGTTVGGDDFIGATIIDLEDRWFSSKWQEMGADGESYEKRKPLELRPLYAPFSSLPQGNIRLWVDILTEPEMAICKPHDISLPPRRQFEVRVVVYRARNVTPGDFTDLSDLFVKCWLQSRDDKAQVTDTHWRARDGKASFNWRMKFNIELPIDDDNEADKGYLHLQLWDKDLVYDDCLADSVVDLSMFLRQAYRSNQVVNVFAKKKQVRMRGLSSASNPKQMSTMHSESSSEDAVTVSMSRASEASRPLLQGSSRYDRNESSASGRSTPQRSPSYHTSPSSTRPQKKRQSAEQRKEQAESLVKSIRNMFGMGDDAEDASWLTFTTRDPVTGDRVRAGELLVSVEILPVAVAQVRAAGLGRSQPNNFPVLQEPVGRLHLSAMWNPLYVLEALIGPKYYGAFKSAMVCALVVAVLIFAGPLINTIVTLLDHIPFPYGFIVFGVLVLAATAAFYHFVRSCRRAIQL